MEELRALAYENLSAAMILGLEMSLEELRAKGVEAALNWFRAREVEA